MSRGLIIFIGVIAFFAIVIGVCLIKGMSLKEILCLIFEIESNNTSNSKISEASRKKIGIGLICASVILVVVFIIGSLSLPDGSSSATCGVCGKSFKSGSDNASSIARSNMCDNCHDNFEWRQDVQNHIDNQPIN